MRTRFQALLSSTAIAAAIAGAALMSSGSTRFANADVVTDVVREQLTALMNSQGAAIPEATRTAVSGLLDSTTDGAALLDRLNGLAAQNAALAETIGSALGKASLSLQLSDPSAATQVNAFVSSAANANMLTGYAAAQRPITAQNRSASYGVQVAQRATGQPGFLGGGASDSILQERGNNPELEGIGQGQGQGQGFGLDTSQGQGQGGSLGQSFGQINTIQTFSGPSGLAGGPRQTFNVFTQSINRITARLNQQLINEIFYVGPYTS